jgi:GH43 family beta-xylosidase
MKHVITGWSRSMALIALALATLAGCATQGDSNSSSTAERDGTFTNPLFPNGADPWLEYWDGNYYLTTTTWTAELVMRKSPTLAGLADATPVNIWSDTDPKRNANFWAFEFHRLKGPNGYRWYVMYTAGQDGTLDHQHLNVLESVGDDPMGPYEYKAPIMPDQWNIDGTYLKQDGKLYLLYSQWHGDEQLNLITEMENPWTLKEGSPKTVITRPELDWEISGRKVTEAAQILQRNGRTFMIYSASYCNTPDYKLGMLELVGDNPLNADHWKQYPEPVFQRGNGVYGPGHNGFFPSPDGTEDWLVYHGNSSVEHGCSSTRSLRAQKFTWNEDGTPNFGEPIPEGQPVQRPSGENGPLVTRIQGQHFQIVNATTDLCLDIATAPEDNRTRQAACNPNNGQWVIDPVTDGYFRIANNHDSKFLEVENCSTGDNARVQQAAWRNNACQEWSLETGDGGHSVITNRATGKPLAVAGCSANENQSVLQQSEDSVCKQWRLQPMNEVAIISEQSGRVVSVAGDDANVEQHAWTYGDHQKWRFKPTDSGYFELSPSSADDQCLAVTDEAVVPGANLEVDECGSKTSQWGIKFLEGGAVSLVNRYTTEVVDVANCGLADGTNLALGPDLENRCQRFHLRAAN